MVPAAEHSKAATTARVKVQAKTGQQAHPRLVVAAEVEVAAGTVVPAASLS